MGLFGVRAETAPRYAGIVSAVSIRLGRPYSARGLLDPYNIVRKFGDGGVFKKTCTGT